MDGLGLLDLDTAFGAPKVVRRRRGSIDGCPIEGYEIRHGRPARRTDAAGWLDPRDEHGHDSEGAISADRGVMGTSLHGMFEADAFRHRSLSQLAQRRGATIEPCGRAFTSVRMARLDRMADLVERHLDITALLRQMPTETVRTCRIP